MKTLNFYLIFSFAVLFIQCKEKVDQNIDSNVELEEQVISPDDQSDISVTIYDYIDSRALNDVVIIAINQRGDTISLDTTGLNGNATLTNVQALTDYTFSKGGFLSQTIQFLDYNKLNEINVYLKPDVGLVSPTVNVRGIVSNSVGLPVGNVVVSSNKSTSRSQSDGFYSLDIQGKSNTFPLNYIQGNINGALRMKVNEDTVIVDVFIDGFTNDTITVK